MTEIKSELRLRELLFDTIAFNRLGTRNNNKLQTRITVQLGEDKKQNLYRIILSLKFRKEDEYEGEIVLHGIFTFASDSKLEMSTKNALVRQNTVAIMMPYVRSELTLLTAQPGAEPVVLPPLNVINLLEKK